MRPPGLKRYALEWLVLVSLLWVAAAVAPELGASEAASSAMMRGAMVCAFLHLPAFLVLSIGLWIKPDKFLLFWGIALMIKLGLAMGIIAVANWQKFESYRRFLLGLGVAFPMFALHQAFRLVREQRSLVSGVGGAAVGETLV